MTNTVEREVPTLSAENSLGSLMARAEIDQQVVTAHRFPRSITNFRREVLDMVTLSEAIADECIYALPRDGKTVEGPSARFAEVVASAWGNCRAGSRVIDERGQFVVAQGVFHDLQRNVAITYEVQRRIVDRNGNRFKPDMIGVTANAACSIALRNAVLKGVPKAFWSEMYEAARKVVMGDFTTLENRRAVALEHFQKFGVSPQQIFDKLGVAGVADITLEHIVTLKGLLTALKEGDTTIEDAFPQKEAAATSGSRSAGQRMREAIRQPSDASQEQQAPTTADAQPADVQPVTTSEEAQPVQEAAQPAPVEPPAPLGDAPDVDADTIRVQLGKADTVDALELTISLADTLPETVRAELHALYRERRAALEGDGN